MVFEYKCSECQSIELKEFSMKEDIPSKMVCPKCGNIASRVWGNQTIKIPDHFKALSDINDGGFADFDNLKSTFKHARRPSGKEKVFY